MNDDQIEALVCVLITVTDDIDPGDIPELRIPVQKLMKNEKLKALYTKSVSSLLFGDILSCGKDRAPREEQVKLIEDGARKYAFGDENFAKEIIDATV